MPPTCAERSREETEKFCLPCSPGLASSLHGFVYHSTTLAEPHGSGWWGVQVNQEQAVGWKGFAGGTQGDWELGTVQRAHSWAPPMVHRMAMMEVVQPGPSSGQAALPSCLTRWEGGTRSHSKGLRGIRQGELDALGKLAELWHCKPWCCLSLFKERL